MEKRTGAAPTTKTVVPVAGKRAAAPRGRGRGLPIARAPKRVAGAAPVVRGGRKGAAATPKAPAAAAAAAGAKRGARSAPTPKPDATELDKELESWMQSAPPAEAMAE